MACKLHLNKAVLKKERERELRYLPYSPSETPHAINYRSVHPDISPHLFIYLFSLVDFSIDLPIRNLIHDPLSRPYIIFLQNSLYVLLRLQLSNGLSL